MAKRWTIPFVSRQSKQCRIDIYDPSWSGAVTELSTNNANAPGVAAEDPFYFEEDDDEDLLSVIRIKTGYINLIETTFGGLDDLYASSIKNRYVEVYYDGNLAFRGYIQPQSFENSWQAAPREVSLPVISVLGLVESQIELNAEMPLTDQKLGYYMKQLIDKIDSTEHTQYSRVVFPKVANCPEFAGTIRPTVVCEVNSGFSPAVGASGIVYKGITLQDFIEGVCHAYGWICHDLPDQLLFTMYDQTPNGSGYYEYEYYTIGNLATASSKSSVDSSLYANPMTLDTYMEPCSDDATISRIMPARTVRENFEGEIVSSVKADYDHMQCTSIYTYQHDGNEEYAVFLGNPTGNQYPDVDSSHMLAANVINPDFTIQNNGAFVLDLNGTKRLITKNLKSWTSKGDTIATLYFYKRPIISNYAASDERYLMLSLDLKTGDKITSYGHYELRHSFIFELWCGNSMVATRSINCSDNNYTLTFYITESVPNINALRLVIKNNDESWAEDYWPLLFFDDIRISYYEASYGKYRFDNSEYTFIGNLNGTEDITIDMLMSCYKQNSNTIGTTTGSNFATYQYLRNPQDRLQIRMQPKTSQSLSVLMAYINKLLYWQQSWRWRLIAMSFNPWNDEYTLTLHHSTTID